LCDEPLDVANCSVTYCRKERVTIGIERLRRGSANQARNQDQSEGRKNFHRVDEHMKQPTAGKLPAADCSLVRRT